VVGLDFPGPTEVLVGRPVGQVRIIVRDLESSCRVDGDGAFAYFDTEHDLGYLLEVVQPPGTRREPDLMIR
jgi:hypothetical protein